MRVALNVALDNRACGSAANEKYSEQDRQENVMQKMHGAANNRSRIQITPHQGSMHAPETARGIQSTSQMEEASSADGLMLGILAACSGQARADDNVTTEIQ